MTDRERIHEMAKLLRSAHCTLDRIATDHLIAGEKEIVLALCQHIRNCYLDAFQATESKQEACNAA